MDFAELNLFEPYRTWHALGLRHVLGERGALSEHIPGAPSPEYMEILERLRSRLAPPHRMVWTYWEFPVDLGPHPSNQRRTLWKNMINGLNLPQGAVFFWPMSENVNNTIVPRPELFWPMLKESEARLFICFGRQAFTALFADRSFAPEPFTHHGTVVLPLPGPDEMLPDKRQVKRSVWAKLNAFLEKNI